MGGGAGKRYASRAGSKPTKEERARGAKGGEVGMSSARGPEAERPGEVRRQPRLPQREEGRPARLRRGSEGPVAPG